MGAPQRSRKAARPARSAGSTTWSAAVTSTGSSPAPRRPRRAALTRPPPVPSRSGSCTTSTPGRPARWAISWSAPWWALTTTRVAPAAWRASTARSTSGRPAGASSGLGVTRVSGVSRVPAPAARQNPITAVARPARSPPTPAPRRAGPAAPPAPPSPRPRPGRRRAPAPGGRAGPPGGARSRPGAPAEGQQQRPPGPGLVDRGPQGHRGQVAQAHEHGPAEPGPGPHLVQVVHQVEEPRSPAARPTPAARAGRERPPARTGPGTRPRRPPGRDPPARVGQEDQERPGPGAGQLGDRDLGAVAQQEEHAGQLRLGPPAGVVRNQSSGTW